MAKSGYSAMTGAAVALAAGTAKSVLGVRGNAAFGIDLKKFTVSFDGTSASATPVLVEICYATFATNAPGTNSTSVTPQQNYGRAIAHGVTAARNWTSEPTVLTVARELLLTPAGGVVLYDWPLGDTPDSAASEGYVIRCTAPAAVNVRGGLWWERC
ncbi:hypothetical protein ACQEU3_46735 [Spirillospora sp. CA-253888]